MKESQFWGLITMIFLSEILTDATLVVFGGVALAISFFYLVKE